MITEILLEEEPYVKAIFRGVDWEFVTIDAPKNVKSMQMTSVSKELESLIATNHTKILWRKRGLGGVNIAHCWYLCKNFLGILTLIADGVYPVRGVQAATRPQAGLSPPESFSVTTGSDANLLSPEQRTAGIDRRRLVCPIRITVKIVPRFPLVVFPSVPTSINSSTTRVS